MVITPANEQERDQVGELCQRVQEIMGQTGFVLLPRRWVVERSFAWGSRFCRLARDYERLSITLQQLHFVVFACIILARNANSA